MDSKEILLIILLPIASAILSSYLTYYFTIKSKKAEAKLTTELKLIEGRNEMDRKLLLKIKVELLPPTGSINFIRTYNFAGAFQNDSLEQFHCFINEIKNPEHEFIDAKLNRCLEDLKRNVSKFLDLIVTNTWPVKNQNSNAYRVPPEWDHEQPERFRKVVDGIHEASNDICKSYDDLVKIGKMNLAI